MLNLSRLVENPNYLEEKQQYLSIKGIGHIESKRIQLIKELGEGAFGRVRSIVLTYACSQFKLFCQL